MIEVDGSSGEGGGQILRTAIALATLLEQRVRVFNIRAGRSEPGLKAQHLTGVKAAATVCSGSLTGANVGSTELTFTPGKPKDGIFRFDVGTAGSITLVLQTLMPMMAYAPARVEVEVTGGTDVKWSPPADYLRLVVLPLLNRLGYQGRLEILRRGHYPKGGGRVYFSTTPTPGFLPLKGMDPGEITDVDCVSHAVGLPSHVAERQAEAAKRAVRAGGLPNPHATIDAVTAGDAVGPGSGIVLNATSSSGALLGADSLGERGKPAEEVGSQAGKRLVDEVHSGAFLDRHMGDMIVPYLVIADGVSEVSVSQVTEHTLTNVKIAQQIAGVSFEIHGSRGDRGVLRVRGLGLQNSRASS